MKQLHTHLCWLTYAILILFTMNGCNEETYIRFLENELQGDIIVGKKVVTSVEMMTINSIDLQVSGGSIPYSVSTDKPALLTAQMTDNNLRIIPKGEEGIAEVTVTDKNNHSGTLTVSIIKKSVEMSIDDIKIDIQMEDGSKAPAEWADEILKDLPNRSKIQCDKNLLLTYEAVTDKGYEGTFQIYSNQNAATPLQEGTFKLGPDTNLQTTCLEFQYDNIQELYYTYHSGLDIDNLPELRSRSAVFTSYLLRNITSLYKNTYPGVKNITEAVFFNKVSQ